MNKCFFRGFLLAFGLHLVYLHLNKLQNNRFSHRHRQLDTVEEKISGLRQKFERIKVEDPVIRRGKFIQRGVSTSNFENGQKYSTSFFNFNQFTMNTFDPNSKLINPFSENLKLNSTYFPINYNLTKDPNMEILHCIKDKDNCFQFPELDVGWPEVPQEKWMDFLDDPTNLQTRFFELVDSNLKANQKQNSTLYDNNFKDMFDEITLNFEAKNLYNQTKTYGGDFLLARLVNSNISHFARKVTNMRKS